MPQFPFLLFGFHAQPPSAEMQDSVQVWLLKPPSVEAAGLCFVTRWEKPLCGGIFWQVNPLGWDMYDVTMSVGT